MTEKDLVDMLSPTIGAAKACEVVAVQVRRHRLAAEFSREEALNLLEAIASTTGIVGISARFAKVKVSLRQD